jgi:chromosomal replication initiation ATPase DnaA
MNTIELINNQIKELENRVKKMEDNMGVPPTISALRKRFDTMIEATCELTSVTKDQLMDKKRGTRKIVTARQLICFVACEHMAMSVTEVAKKINRDHSSIIHSKNAYSDMLTMKYPEETGYYRDLMRYICR